MFFMVLNRQQNAYFGLLFSGFLRYWKSVGVMFLMDFIPPLVGLLVALPGIGILVWEVSRQSTAWMVVGVLGLALGIIAAIMVTFMLILSPFIIDDGEPPGPVEALRLSRALMRGMTWKFSVSRRVFSAGPCSVCSA